MVGYVISLFKQIFNNDGLRKSVWTEDLNKDDVANEHIVNRKLLAESGEQELLEG